MPDSLDDAILAAKAEKRKAAQMELLEEIGQQGLETKKDEKSAFEVGAENITDAMHTSLQAELVELHSFIPQKVLPSVYEIALIAQAAYKEQRHMQGFEWFETKTKDGKGGRWRKVNASVIDKVTEAQNEIIVQELIENTRILMRQLSAINGYRSEQGVKNLGSLVTGQSALNASQNPFLEMQKQGIVDRVKGFFGGKK